MFDDNPDEGGTHFADPSRRILEQEKEARRKVEAERDEVVGLLKELSSVGTVKDALDYIAHKGQHPKQKIGLRILEIVEGNNAD